MDLTFFFGIQIKELRENADKLKVELGEYQQRCLKQVEEYSAELRDQRDSKEHTWRSTTKKLSDATGTELVAKYDKLDEKLDSILPAEYEPKPKLPKMLYFGSAALNGELHPKFLCSMEYSHCQLPLSHIEILTHRLENQTP